MGRSATVGERRRRVAAAWLPDDLRRTEGADLHHARPDGCRRTREHAGRGPPAARFLPGAPAMPDPACREGGSRSVWRNAEFPVILAGRVSRERRRLAAPDRARRDARRRRILAISRSRLGFPTDHVAARSRSVDRVHQRRRRRADAPRGRDPEPRLVGSGDAVQAGVAGRRRDRQGRFAVRSTAICTAAGPAIISGCRRSTSTSSPTRIASFRHLLEELNAAFRSAGAGRPAHRRA